MKIILLLLSFAPFIVHGQLSTANETTIISLYHADKQTCYSGMGNTVLSGNVFMQISNTKITCDSAVINYREHTLSAYGNVTTSSPSGTQLYTTRLITPLSDTTAIACNDASGHQVITTLEADGKHYVVSPVPFKRTNEK